MKNAVQVVQVMLALSGGALLAFFWLWVGFMFFLPGAQQGFAPGYLLVALFPYDWRAELRSFFELSQSSVAWALPLVLIAGFPAVLFIAVPALLVLTVWVPVRRSVERIGDVPFGLRVAIRGAWLAVAIAGLIALARDVGELV